MSRFTLSRYSRQPVTAVSVTGPASKSRFEVSCAFQLLLWGTLSTGARRG